MVQQLFCNNSLAGIAKSALMHQEMKRRWLDCGISLSLDRVQHVNYLAPCTIGGFPVIVDETVLPTEIHFVDGCAGVGKIVNIGVPK